MNKHEMTELDRELAVAQADALQKLLKHALPRIDPSMHSENFERVCALYAQTVLVKLRLGVAPSL
jgi:hypothetical protein